MYLVKVERVFSCLVDCAIFGLFTADISILNERTAQFELRQFCFELEIIMTTGMQRNKIYGYWYLYFSIFLYYKAAIILHSEFILHYIITLVSYINGNS